MKKPTEQLRAEVKRNGNFGRTVKYYSYVVTLCEIDGERVQAVRIEYFMNKFEARKYIDANFPGWKVKTINRLYDEDFNEGY